MSPNGGTIPTTLEYVSGDLDHPDLAQFIVTLQGRPFAYLQCYQISEWHDSFGPQPAGTRGLDQFIGEADMLGRGHGSAFVRAFIEQLFAAGVPRSRDRSAPGQSTGDSRL